MLNKEPRVLIACPTVGLNPDPDQWLTSLIRILNDCRRNGFTHAIFCPYILEWWPANNRIWDCAFSEKFDYILRIDDDIHGVPDDAFTKLLAADKTVIGAAYPNRAFPYTVNAMVRTDQTKTFEESYNHPSGFLQSVQFHGYEGTEPQQVELIGFGMTLIKVAPFKYMDRPIYQGEQTCPDDSYFAQLCMDNNITQWVHWGVRLKHRHVTFANSGHLYNADMLEAHPELKEEENRTNVLLAEPLQPEVVNA